MDFQTLNRRQLQTLCKLNKIPANITNIAMADALKSLETVEGIEEFLNPSRTESVGLSIGSPERIEVTSPRKKAKKMDVNKVLETPLVSCTRKNDPETVQTARRSTRLALKRSGRLSVSVSVTSKEYLGKHNDVVLDETHESEIHESSKIDKVVHVDTTTTTLEKVDSSGDVDNLNMKFDKIFGEFGDLDLNERQNDGEKFNNSDDKSGQLDNLNPVSECICNPSESSKSDNHNVDEVMNAKDIEENLSANTVDFVYLKKQKVSMNFESRAKEPQESVIEVEAIEELLNLSRSETGGMSIESPERIEATSPRKKAKIDVNEVLKSPMVSKKALTPSSSSPSQLTECEDIASLVSKSTPQQDTVSSNNNSQVIERETSEEAVNINLFLNEEKHDVIVLDESLRIEKVDKSSEVETSVQFEAIMDIQEPQQTLMPTIHHLNSQQLNQEGDFNEEEGQISIREVSEVSVVEIEKNNNEKEEDVKDEKGNSLVKSSSSSLRQLKKRLKETLSKSPTPVKIKIKNEEKIDEKEGGGDDKKAKSLNDARSMRQLKKQLKKALSGQCNKDTKS